jgi:dipeptidyl aminopeptidase/acylaminoacyl peptidase
MLQCLAAMLAMPAGDVVAQAVESPRPLAIEDLYTADQSLDGVSIDDGRAAVYCRRRADAETRRMRQSLWRVDPLEPPRPLEAGEPDGFGPVLSPDGAWIAFLSTRPLPDGTPACPPVPVYSHTAANIWLIPVAGGRAIPLAAGPRAYGRVVTDTFYGRLSFSHDGRRLAFVADDGIDPRTDAERRNSVTIVRDGQGEGYEGYSATQIWVADLATTPTDTAATRIRKMTDDGFWYGDPQWWPDDSHLVVHANRTADQEPVASSMNRNFDLWRIGIEDRRLTQITTGPGPEFSPRISPDGKRLVCLSSPRKGPHLDVLNLMVLERAGDGFAPRLLFDHHAAAAGPAPHLPPVFPLPVRCWADARRVTFTGHRGPLSNVPQTVDVDAGPNLIEPVPAAVRRPAVPPADPALAGRLRAADEIVRWKSFDGLEIEGVLTVPPPSIAKPPYKLLVWPHGGPHSRAVMPSTFDVQIFAMNGFAVFQPMYRGSAGYGLRFLEADRNDLGGGDVRDILAGIEHLVGLGVADRGRQFVLGTSFGGFLAARLIGQTDQFRAAVIQNAVLDLTVAWHLSDVRSWCEWDMSGRPWEVPDRYRDHSPLTHAAKVKTPTLIQHSINDLRVPIAMGQMFHRVLKTNGVATEMVVYPDEGHTIRQLPHREDVLRRALDWFAKHAAGVK